MFSLQGQDFFLADLVAEKVLPAQVFQGDAIEIGDDQGADPGAGQGHGAVGTEPAAAGNADTDAFQLFKF